MGRGTAAEAQIQFSRGLSLMPGFLGGERDRNWPAISQNRISGVANSTASTSDATACYSLVEMSELKMSQGKAIISCLGKLVSGRAIVAVI